jgi:hypothetical protein
MRRIREDNKNRVARPSYIRATCKCILEYEEPTISEIKREMCYNGYCPRSICEFAEGKKNGESCGHVIAVKILATKALHTLTGE